MAIQKALFTNQADFKNLGVDGLNVNPYIYFDGENLPNDVAISGGSFVDSIAWKGGVPTYGVAGIRGKATKFNGSYLQWRNWQFPAITKATISMWVKFTAADLTGFKALATTRGDTYSNYGFHLATYNGEINLRAYGTGGSADLYSAGLGQSGFKFVANQWYNVTFLYDPTEGSYDLQVYVDGSRKLWGNIAFNFIAFERTFTVGDLDGSLPFNGTIDHVLVLTNENSFSQAQVVEYYDKTSNGQFLDSETTSGSLQLGKNLAGAYPTTPISWISKTIDLGGVGKFVEAGMLEAIVQLPSAATTLSFFTRTSANNSTWEVWKAVDGEGLIQSTNQRYVQIKVDMQTTNTAQTPIVESITVLEFIPKWVAPSTIVKSGDPLILYRDLDTGLDSLGVVKNAYEIIIEDVVNGKETLTFKLPIKDKKRTEIGKEPVEMIANLGNRYFIVKEITDKRADDGSLFTEFVCEARWTELRDWYVDGINIEEQTPKFALDTIFANVFRETGDPLFDWTVGEVEPTKKRSLKSEWSDVLTLIRAVQDTWGGEVFFDSKTKTVNFVEQIGKNAGVRFYFNKNVKNVERQIESYNLVTRIYPTGKGELDITTVNGGVAYLENLEWVNKLNLRRKIIPYKWKDERYTIPMNLKEDGQKMLDEMSKPVIRYSTSVHDLSTLSGHEHETFELGDTVTIVDNDLFGEIIVNRIVRRKQDVRKPENTDIELSQPMKTLADIQSRLLDDSIQNLVESDPLSTTDVQQMNVFNQLLNTRFDDGFSEWVHTPDGTQFELANVGFSGNWSAKVTPDYGVEAQLTQTVEGVSHRSSYTISAAVATEGDITRGSDPKAFIGIKVLVYYEGETIPEEHFLAIPDITVTTTE